MEKLLKMKNKFFLCLLMGVVVSFFACSGDSDDEDGGGTNPSNLSVSQILQGTWQVVYDNDGYYYQFRKDGTCSFAQYRDYRKNYGTEYSTKTVDQLVGDGNGNLGTWKYDTENKALNTSLTISPVSKAGSVFEVSIIDEYSWIGKVTVGESTTNLTFIRTLASSFNGDENFSLNLKAACDTGTVADAVDLGLSVKWASHNLGGRTETDQGGFFYLYDLKYAPGIEKIPSDSVCGSRCDVARVKWGDQWRLPTLSELKELQSCKWELIKDGDYGWKVTGPNGKSIFFPYTAYGRGYYCPKTTKYLNIASGDHYKCLMYSEGNRRHIYNMGSHEYSNYNIRPVYTK